MSNATNCEDETMSESAERAQGLRAWAEGMNTTAAAAELLIHYGPPLLDGTWVEPDPAAGRWWFNTQTAHESGGWLSGGEQRVLDIAIALADDEHPVALGSAVAGLDRNHLRLVLAAIAHASGDSSLWPQAAGDEPSQTNLNGEGAR